MEIKIVISDRIVQCMKRAFSRRYVVIGILGMFLIVGGYVFAVNETPPHTFQPNTVISSSQMNESFANLYKAVSDLEKQKRKLFRVTFDVKAAAFDWAKLSQAVDLPNRSLTFTKQNDNTLVRVAYTDYAIAQTAGVEFCEFESVVLFNGFECTKPAKISRFFASENSSTAGGTATVIGSCAETILGPIKKGPVTITVRLQRGYSNKATPNCLIDVPNRGFGSIDAEEVD